MKSVFTILLVFIISMIYSQTFESIELKGIYYQLENIKIDESDKSLLTSSSCKDITIRQINNNNRISHLGIFLFEDIDSCKVQKNIPLFIERELLNLYLTKTKTETWFILKKNKLIISQNGIILNKNDFADIKIMILDMCNYTHIHIRFKNAYCITEIKTQNGEYILRFPTDIQTLKGMDKRELDDALYTTLCKDTNFNSYNNCSSFPEINDLYDSGNYFVLKGQNHVINELNTNKYYQLTADSLVLIYDKNYIGESLINLFYCDNYLTRKFQFTLSQRLYNGEKKNIQMTLGAFITGVKDDYMLFTGFETESETGVVITVLLFNPNENFSHIIKVSTTEKMLFEEKKIYGQIHSFIPVQDDSIYYNKKTTKGNKYPQKRVININ